MSEELKKKLIDAAERCAEEAGVSQFNSQSTLDYARSAEALTRAVANLVRSESFQMAEGDPRFADEKIYQPKEVE